MADDKILEKIRERDKRFDEHDKRLDAIDKRFDALTLIVVEHRERLDQTLTKTEFEQFRKEQSDANDQMITILKRLDQERYATITRIKRLEEDLEQQKKKTAEHDTTLQRIKHELQLSF